MLMTAYNIVNGVRASENVELVEGILRGEWGYEGMVTTDWQTLGDPVRELLAYNDIKMPYSYPDQVKAALENGTLTREVLCVCVKHILEMILWLE